MESKEFKAGFAARDDISTKDIYRALNETNTEDLVGEDFFKGFKAGFIFSFVEKGLEVQGLDLDTYILNAATNYFNLKGSRCESATSLSMLRVRQDLNKAFATKDSDQIIAVAVKAVNDILSPLKEDTNER